MEQVIVSGRNLNNLDDTVTWYTKFSQAGWGATEADAQEMIAGAGTLKSLRVKLTGAPGAGKDYTFTVQIDGNPTALVVTISNAETQDSDLMNTVAVSAGELLSLMCVPSGTPTEVAAVWSIIFEGDVAKESLILGGSASQQYANDGADYANGLSGGQQYQNLAQEDRARQMVSTGGTIKSLYIEVRTPPGGANNVVFTVMLDGVATALTVTLTGAATTGSDLVNNIAFAGGDAINIRVTCDAAAFPSEAYWGCVFEATIDGESLILGSTFIQPSQADTQYQKPHQYTMGWQAVEANAQQLGQECIIRNLYIEVNVAPGAGNSHIYTLRLNGGATLLTVTVNDAETEDSNTVNDIAIADFDLLALEHDPDSTPANAYHHWGMTVFRAVGWKGKIAGVTDPASIGGVDAENIAEVKGVVSA